MLALLPTNNPAPMLPPPENSGTCRERRERLSVGTAGGVTAIGAKCTQTPRRMVGLMSALEACAMLARRHSELGAERVIEGRHVGKAARQGDIDDARFPCR